MNQAITTTQNRLRPTTLREIVDFTPILLSPPHMGTAELQFVQEAFQTNWIAPVGPHVDAFEQEFATTVGTRDAAAVSTGTAALHLALTLLDIQPGDEIFCSTLTFVASANPITYCGAKPIFIDSDRTSWNMDPELLEQALKQRDRIGRLPKAVIVVHLYGQCADIAPIIALCDRYNIPVIEDAAEALGATYQGKSPGSFGRMGIYSFNGNKMITTSGGGMLVADDQALIKQARFFATQAKDPVPYYQHSQVGYNYRLSNILAGIGRGQLQVLADRVRARRENFDHYAQGLSELPGLEFMPEASYGESCRWLTCLTIDPQKFGATSDQVRRALAAQRIESRPVWKPLHLQPIFAGCEHFGGAVAETLFDRGLCLPSGSNLRAEERQRVIDIVTQLYRSH
ncbi:aminotransferase class I/II-fold pyridoxal phosphate-dependent enzyme [filamentous cyanobacterium LEGE 11480]|uniref:Aminotransferase class I/II-fold pyridoxal phosphate-dependent enzyme n=1 Tax=Romeriopsis navalis LEGE 11480 TaxID=2777977 RepID=A0A928VI01_9CYAN|nr:aminotransferase class I/II-fold pyridoxal phosphate-dependent enzyme [Romeriopsis navalis]MBE9028695.1 aminotransferase class I/II-fold pyridoxal phosphate-dependent enzyme [Romeriopsis navalis LEGE 11480]